MFQPPVAQAVAAIQTNWAPIIADPTKGYPIVNFSLLFVVQCYADQNVANALIGVIRNTINQVYDNAILASGFLPAPGGTDGTWGGAVSRILISNSRGYNLDINNLKACAKITRR